MTQQDDITQRVLTDDEIRDIITGTHQAFGEFKSGYMLVLGRAIESALLSKLRAPVADERAAFEAWALTEFTHPFMLPDPLIPDPDGSGDYVNRDVQMAWAGYQQALAALASAPVADARQSWPRAGKLEIECDPDRFGPTPWHITDGFHHAIGATPNEALNRFHHHIASAPVAGEARPVACLRRQIDGSDWGHWKPGSVEDGQRVTGLRSWQVRWLVDAAPQASAENVRKPIMTVAEFCTEADRIGLTADTLAAQLAQRPEFADCLPQADKDGECQPCNGMGIVDGVGDRCPACNGEGSTDRQQRAGEVPSDDALAQIGYAAAIAEVGWGEAWADLESDGDTQQEWRAGAKAIRAALSAPQAEQGERDA